MVDSYRISVADDELEMREYLAELLPRAGHEMVSSAENGRELIEHVVKHEPDLIITDVIMPEIDGIEAVSEKGIEMIPVIIISGHHDPELIQRASAAQVLSYLTKPAKGPDIEAAITMVMSRYAEFRALRQESSDLRQALEDRKTIEKAKGILMKRSQLDEPSAFRSMQKQARSTNKKLVQVALGIISENEAE